MNNSTNGFITLPNDTKYAVEISGEGEHISTEEEKIGEMVHIVFGGILLVIGTIGNCVSLIVLRSRDLKKLSTCFYMSVLAVADLGKGFPLFINNYAHLL